METFQILSDQFSHFQHLFHRWLAIFCIISSYIFDLSSSPHTWGIPGSITWSQQWRTVHPHLRGAYGTPPRHAVQKQRFIPTCVGHTPAPPHPAPCRSVHPHMRRAYRFTAPFWASVPGSSPHTWGIRCRRLPPLCRCSVHPHIRGAYERAKELYGLGFGSSPHTWGILHIPWKLSLELRFIPTYVGHTNPTPAPGPPSCGSSPHTWGIPAPARPRCLGTRFIPTYVGHTAISHSRCSTRSVHPHIRGAYICLESKTMIQFGSSPHTWGIRIIKRAGLSKITGSSPHTWGIQPWRLFVSQSMRFIPTYVGHTSIRASYAGSDTVHPHIRGAYTGPP